MTEEQQVPPGIVAFKNEDGKIYRNDIITMSYENWVRISLRSDYLPASTIHTISVDGKEYSVGDECSFGVSGRHTIKAFHWVNDQWEIEDTTCGKIRTTRNLSKLPGSQPGKEDDIEFWKDAAFKGAIEKNALADCLQAVLDKIDNAPNDTRYLSVTVPAKKLLTNLKHKETKKFINELFELQEPTIKSQPSQPGKEEVLRAIIKETEGFHGMPQMAKIWELAQIALYQYRTTQPPLPEQGKEDKSQIWRVYPDLAVTDNLHMGYWGNADHAGCHDFKTLKEASDYIVVAHKAALKSKPTDGWSDELICDLITYVGRNFAPGFTPDKNDKVSFWDVTGKHYRDDQVLRSFTEYKLKQTKESINPEMDQEQFDKMSPEQQKTWLEYLSKNKHRIGTI